FFDYTAIFAAHEDPLQASSNLQEHLHLIENWTDKLKIKINCAKFTHTTFTLRAHFNRENVKQAKQVTYLGITLDSKLTWRPHIIKKRQQMDLKAAELNWLLGRKSNLSLSNKLLIYKAVIRPIWTYGIKLWGTAFNSAVDIIKRSQ
ncbi:hypothetical protein B7P43_G06332, partial [Cryptotermes secundus]